MYESPIEIIQTEMQMQMDEGILKAVQGVEIDVNKEELIKALDYDREQYSKGYKDGVKEFAERFIDEECAYCSSESDEMIFFKKRFDNFRANGVVVPTFNIGDKVWFVPKGLKEVCEATVVRIEYNYFTNPQEWLVIDYFSSIVGKQEYKSRIDLMLNKTVFRTREEAEQSLKGAKE